MCNGGTACRKKLMGFNQFLYFTLAFNAFNFDLFRKFNIFRNNLIIAKLDKVLWCFVGQSMH